MPQAEHTSGSEPAASFTTRQRVRATRIATWALLAVGLPLAVRSWVIDVTPAAFAIGGAMLAGAATLAWFERAPEARVGAAGQISLGILFALFTYVACTTGGFGDPSFAWFFVLPVAAISLSGLRSGLVWGGVAVVATLVFWWLDVRGVPLPTLVDPDLLPSHGVVTRLSLIATLTLLTSSLVYAQRSVERELVAANRDLRREAMCVQLLEHGAAAANEASTFAAALTSCSERVMRTTGWRIAHVWLPAPDDSGDFVSASIWITDEPDRYARLQDLSFAMRIARDDAHDAIRSIVASGAPRWAGAAELAADPSPRARCATELGLGCAVGLPICSHEGVIAVLEFFGPDDDAVDERRIRVLADVGRQIGRVAERLRLQEKLRQSQKLESVGQLAAGIAHEINNPMAYVRSNLGLLREEWAALGKDAAEQGWPAATRERLADCEELIDDALEGVNRTVAIVRDVREFSGGGEARFELADPNELVESALRVATPQQPSGVEVERGYGSVAPLECLPGQLRQVFLNLIVNAFQAMGAHGRLAITTRVAGSRLVVAFEDDGCGIEEGALGRLFDPFFTTKPAGEGTGLGLFISYEIVRAHGGEIAVDSLPGKGARFEVQLPLRQARAER
ncbi:MAG: ATP-binding protein [Myxococcota bacterium]|nr:GAF domain-containing protein [Myxococcales bacterium]